MSRSKAQSEDGDDGRVSVGVRHMFADSFEGWIKGHYTDGDFYDGSFSASIGGQFKFNPTWGVVGEVEAGDDLSTLHDRRARQLLTKPASDKLTCSQKPGFCRAFSIF